MNIFYIARSTFKKLSAIAILLLVSTACSSLPDRSDRELSKAFELLEKAREGEAQAYAQMPGSKKNKVSKSANNLRELILLALKENRDVKAAELVAKAKAERVPQVVALPDPVLYGKFLPTPIRTAEGDNFFNLGLKQKFPFPGKLEGAGQVALAELDVAIARLREVCQRVIRDVKKNYFTLFVTDKSAEIIRANKVIIRGLVDVALAQVASGKRPQDDVLRAQVEESNLQAILIGLRQRRASTVSRLNELLNRPTRTKIATIKKFGIRDRKLELKKLLTRAEENNPKLLGLRQQIKREKRAAELARLDYWPDLTLGAEWIYMDPRTGNRLSKDGSDNIGLSFGINIPIQWGRIRAKIREAEYKTEAAEKMYQTMHNKIEFALSDSLERLRAQTDLAKIFSDTIIPQAKQTYELSQVSYSAGKSDFLIVIDNWQKWFRFNIQYYRSLGEMERSASDLEQALGVALAELESKE